MSYTPTYKRPYEQWKELPSKETLCTAEVLTQYDDTFENIEEYLESEGKKEYALVTEAGYSIVASIDEYYVLTVVLKNKAGDVLSTSEPIDLPIESMIINVDYDEESGILTFSLQNGQTLDVNISTLVRGLVPTSRKIAGVDLEDDITAEELKTALGVFDNTVTAGTLKPWLYDSDETVIGVRDGKPLYRKSFDFSSSDFTGVAFFTFDTEHDVNYYDHIYITDGSYWTPNSQGNDMVKCFPINYYHSDGEYIRSNVQHSSTYNWCVVLKSTVSSLLDPVNVENAHFHLVLEYTKNEDAEGSGNNLNPYGIYDAKLDDVKSTIASVSNEVDAVENKLTAYPYTVVKLMTEEAIDNYYDTVGENLGTTDTHYTRVIQHGVSHSVLKGGNYFLEGYRANNNFEWQKITLYSVDGETRKFERSKINAVWTEWVSTSFKADIDAINSRLDYKDISSSIDVGDTGCTALGYVENGQVIIRITYPAGAKGDKRLNVDIAYGPRMTVYGSANGNASDFGKLTTSWISPEGVIFVHASEKPEVEMTAIFTYPLKTS